MINATLKNRKAFMLMVLSFILLSAVFPEISSAENSTSEIKNTFEQDEDENLIIRAKWRAGEIARYEFSENVMIYSDGELIEERTHRYVIQVDVAAVRGREGFVMLWRLQQTDAPLFNDDVLDSHMYGLLADGIVIHTDMFGGYSHSSNMEELFGQFENAVEILDERGHWQHQQEVREEIQAYIDYPDLFEELLIRDMRFMFGLHGVQVFTDEVYEYDTWQQNPWGEAVESTGKLFVHDYNREKQTINLTNEVELADQSEENRSLAEIQHYSIFLDSGWINTVELRDDIVYDDFIRNRRLNIRKLPN